MINYQCLDDNQHRKDDTFYRLHVDNDYQRVPVGEELFCKLATRGDFVNFSYTNKYSGYAVAPSVFPS